MLASLSYLGLTANFKDDAVVVLKRDMEPVQQYLVLKVESEQSLLSKLALGGAKATFKVVCGSLELSDEVQMLRQHSISGAVLGDGAPVVDDLVAIFGAGVSGMQVQHVAMSPKGACRQMAI